jgi:hypothetical protein
MQRDQDIAHGRLPWPGGQGAEATVYPVWILAVVVLGAIGLPSQRDRRDCFAVNRALRHSVSVARSLEGGLTPKDHGAQNCIVDLRTVFEQRLNLLPVMGWFLALGPTEFDSAQGEATYRTKRRLLPPLGSLCCSSIMLLQQGDGADRVRMEEPMRFVPAQ